MPLAVCATPIGNLEDVTLRVLRELAEADTVLCEDTRRTRVLLQRHGISARVVSYHEHNEAERTRQSCCRGSKGRACCAGVRRRSARDQRPRRSADRGRARGGRSVTVLPGPSAVETALVASGFSAERYQFVGYLPRGAAALRALWDDLAGWPWPAVAFDSPQRLPATLRSLADAYPERRVAVCRELTKQFEEVVRGSASGGRRVPGGAQGRDHPRARRMGRERAGRGCRNRRRHRARRRRRPPPSGNRSGRSADGGVSQRSVSRLSVTELITKL